MTDINIMETLLNDSQDNALLRYTMGAAFIKHGKFEQALEHLQAAISQKPDYLSAWELYVEALIQTGQTESAIEQLKRAISNLEDDSDITKIKTLLHTLKSD